MSAFPSLPHIMNYLTIALIANSVLAWSMSMPTCQKQKTLSEACTNNAECASDFCFNKTCIALPNSGESCTRVGQRCAAGLGCSAKKKGTCQPLAKESEKCQYSKATGQTLCDEGLLCYKGTCSSPKTENFAITADDGKCGPGFHRHLKVLKFGYKCVQNKKVGQRCRVSRQCESDLYCGNTFTCQPRKALDEKCIEDSCESGLVCLRKQVDGNFLKKLSQPLICQPLPSQGDFCRGKCANGLYCSKIGFRTKKDKKEEEKKPIFAKAKESLNKVKGSVTDATNKAKVNIATQINKTKSAIDSVMKNSTLYDRFKKNTSTEEEKKTQIV